MEKQAPVHKDPPFQRAKQIKYAASPTPDGNLVYVERYGSILSWRKDHGNVGNAFHTTQSVAPVQSMDAFKVYRNTIRNGE